MKRLRRVLVVYKKDAYQQYVQEQQDPRLLKLLRVRHPDALDLQRAHAVHEESLETIILPDMAATVTPLVYAVAVQLIAYHTAAAIGTDVDQPRNLAKSVTVE